MMMQKCIANIATEVDNRERENTETRKLLGLIMMPGLS